MPTTDRGLAYLAWWAKWRIRGLTARDDEARQRMAWEARADLEALLKPPVERDVNGVEIDGP